MNMKKYYSHTLMYLHESIDLGSGRSEQFTDVFSDVYQPMMEELGTAVRDLGDDTVQRALAAGDCHLGDRRVRRLWADRSGAVTRRQSRGTVRHVECVPVGD